MHAQNYSLQIIILEELILNAGLFVVSEYCLSFAAAFRKNSTQGVNKQCYPGLVPLGLTFMISKKKITFGMIFFLYNHLM